MNDYNGFTGSERMIVQQIMDELQKRGIINWKDKPCSVCGGTGGTIHAHLEDYSDVFAFHPICIECHMKLHMRYRFPGYWIKHLLDVKDGYQPVQHKTSAEWFRVKKGKFKYPEFENIDPTTIGGEWYHEIKMQPLNLNKNRYYDKNYNSTNK